MIEPRTALDAVGALPDGEIDVAGAALQLARIDLPEADWRAAEARLSGIARDAVAAAAGVNPGDPPAQAAVLANLLAGRLGFAGDDETYDDLANANLIRVIERRRGLPVALGILWLHAAQAAGWAAHGIDFPGHFLLGLGGARAPAVIDPFSGGQLLDMAALHALLQRVEGGGAQLRTPLFAPMTARDVLLRLQNNIKWRRYHAGDVAGAIACTRDMLRIAPLEPGQWWDLAMLQAEHGLIALALRSLIRFSELAPAEEARRAKAVMDELRSRLN